MNERFAVVNHEFTNTGGNCMVSSFAVYDRQQKVTRYVMVGDEGFSLTTVDIICGEDFFETDEERDAAVLDSWTFDMLTSEPSYCQPQFTEEEFALYKYCQFEFYKKYCEYFKTNIRLTVDELPGEMYNELGVVAIAWHVENEQLVSTDGYKVYPSPYYSERKAAIDRELRQIKDFSSWHEEQAAREELYGDHYMVSFNGRSVKLPYDADTFNAIDDLLKNVIKEW